MGGRGHALKNLYRQSGDSTLQPMLDDVVADYRDLTNKILRCYSFNDVNNCSYISTYM